MPRDLRTKAIVLRRTNYGECDRILNLLTPEGRISALAHGVRKSKSKLAGGVELFSVADVVVHYGKSDMGTLTSAKMINFYKNIMADMGKLELASDFLKKADKAASQTDSSEFFEILEQALAGLNHNFSPDLVKLWFDLNLAQATGEEFNLHFDTSGEKLNPELKYVWDGIDEGLKPDATGKIGANEIKLARLILSAKLKMVANVENVLEILPNIMVIGWKYR